MKYKYYELTEKDADEVSDAGIMLRLLAGELFGLNSYIEWLKRSMFISGAEGEALELHARQRGIERSIGSKAVGSILVEVDSPLEYDVVIPAGTVFSTSDGTLYYESTQQGVIYSGTGRTLLEARAEYSGSRYNVEAGEVTTVVTYFSSGLSISNASAFTGGTDDETDEQLRKRLEASFAELSNGLNHAYYKKLAESDEGVFSANTTDIIQGTNTMNVYLAQQGASVDNATVQRVQAVMTANRIPGIDIRVFAASLTPVNVSVDITVRNGYPVTRAVSDTENAVRSYFSGLKVGEDFVCNKLGAAIIAVEGVDNYTFNNLSDAAGVSNYLFTLGTLAVERSV